MPTFQPAFSPWPRPEFLGNSNKGFSAWIDQRDALEEQSRERVRAGKIRGIIEAHHDRSARTIGPES